MDDTINIGITFIVLLTGWKYTMVKMLIIQGLAVKCVDTIFQLPLFPVQMISSFVFSQG